MDLLFASVFQADPRLCGNKYQRTWLCVIFFVSEPNMGVARID